MSRRSLAFGLLLAGSLLALTVAWTEVSVDRDLPRALASAALAASYLASSVSIAAVAAVGTDRANRPDAASASASFLITQLVFLLTFLQRSKRAVERAVPR